MLRHALGLTMPRAPLFSIELGALLVSVKLVWMIHNQARMEHSQFWILNSIEFRLDDTLRQTQQMEKRPPEPLEVSRS